MRATAVKHWQMRVSVTAHHLANNSTAHVLDVGPMDWGLVSCPDQL